MGYRKKTKRKDQKNRFGKICVSFAVLVLVLVFSVQIVHLYHKNQTYKARQEQLQAQLEAVLHAVKSLDANANTAVLSAWLTGSFMENRSGSVI